MNILTKSIVFTTLCLSFVLSAKAQLNLQQVDGLPSKELYDLYVDKKGYLWIAHDLGISRFDGLNFTHFSCAGQASLSMSGIVEDNHGRIWCHNFSGQIFYIERGQMKLLKAYNYAKELQYPHISICGDELVATSDHGLFICSTRDLSSRYLSFDNRAFTSLTTISKRTILFDGQNWYIYQREKGIKKIKAESALIFNSKNSANIQVGNFGNLVYLTSNPSGLVQKILFRGDSLSLVSQYEMSDFINAVSVGEQTWIHTRNKSRTLDGKLAVDEQGITDVVKDREGNIWFSSLKKGLMVNYKKAQWEIIKPLADNEDFIRCLNVTDGYFFAGTNKGNLFTFDSTFSKINWETRLSDGYGSIDFIRFYKKHRFVVGSSIKTFIVNPSEKKVENLLNLSAVKDVDFDDNSLYLATANGLYMIPYLDTLGLPLWLQFKQQKFPFIKPVQPDSLYLFATKRSRAVRYDTKLRSLFVSFKDGLHQVNETGIHPYLINNKPVFVSSMWYKHPRLFIATFSDGLWIKTDTLLRHFTTSNFLTSNTILRTKATKNHLWLFENDAMQVLDIETETLLKNIDLPKINGANVFDVAEWEGYGYLTTSEGIYKIPMNIVSEDRTPTGYLDAVIVNNRDTLQGNRSGLSYINNDLQFIFSSPAFYNPNTISFRYRVIGADRDWQTTKPGERTVRYASLPPGNYTLQAYAINNKGIQQPEHISFALVINKPWWKQWWFYVLCLIITMASIYLLQEYRVHQLLNVEKVRRTISTDLHDDIGATLSSINIYTELAKKDRYNDVHFTAIQQHSNEVITKLDELIWSINPKNDNFEQLVNRMYSYAEPLLHAKEISCKFNHPEDLLKEKLPVQVKQNLYLVFKELVNNVLKHSGAKHCIVDLSCRDNKIYLLVMDDGKGFDITNTAKGRNGIINMKERVEKMKGHLQIESSAQKGTTAMATIPLPTSYLAMYRKWIKKIKKK